MTRCLLPPARRCLFLLLALGIGVAPAWSRAAAPAVELTLLGVPKPASDDDEKPDKPAPDETLLPPTAAFELRFASPMVAADQVGKEAADSPLVFTPELPGSFRWTSQRGGVYTLSDPPPLGATYQAALRHDLKSADGQPIAGAADLKRAFHMPGLEIGAVIANATENNDLPVRPKMHLVFNSAVSAAKIAPAFSFRSAEGSRIAAHVTPTPENVTSSTWSHLAMRTWREQFLDAHTPADARATAGTPPDSRNRLEIVPASPLTVGGSWKLVGEAGLAGEDPGAKRTTAYEVVVGEVKPLAVSKLAADNGGEGERKLVVTFSKKLAEEITDDNASRSIHVSPAPANLKYDVTNREVVTVAGDFALDRSYTVTVDAGIPAAEEGLKLAAAWTQAAQFDRRPPQLAFPDFSAQQLGVGRREFDLFALNVPDVHLRIKLVPPEQAPLALAQYQKQYYTPSEGHTEKNRVNFDKVPGKVVYDARVKGAPTIDKPETIRLKWDELLGPGRNGVLLLEAEQPAAPKGQKRPGVQALVQVTNLGVVWQIAPGDQLHTFVFSLADASPIGKATVRCLDADGKPLGKSAADSTATADANGLAALSADPANVGWLEAVSGDDCLVVPFTANERNEISTYGFHLPSTAYQSDADVDNADTEEGSNTGAAAAVKKPVVRRDVLVFSDRGVYKPGETVQFKAIVREWHDSGFVNASPDTPVTLRAYDARGRRFFQKAGKLSATGSFSEAIPLPKISLGHYRAQIVFDGNPPDDTDAESIAAGDNGDGDDADPETPQPTVCRFQVEEFQPNAFEVRLGRPPAPPVGEGVTPLPLAARYYMGTPLSRAKVVWSLKAVDTVFTPDGFEDYLFGTTDVDYRLRRQKGELALDGEAALSDKGELTLSPHIVLNATAPSPRRVRVQASVTDQDQQTVTSNASYTVHSSEYYLGLHEMPDVVRAGDPLPLEVVAVNAADGLPRDQPVHVTAKLSHIEWRTQRIAIESGDSDYESTPHLEPVASTQIDAITLHRLGGQWEPVTETPAGLGNLVPTEPGEYLLEINGQDAAGHVVATSTTIDVLGDKEAEWGYRNAWQVQLVPDKAEYHPGDRATILVKTPISGRALVSVEREGVSRSFVTELKKEHPAIEVPVMDADAPNVFVSVLLLRGVGESPRRIKMPEYRAGYCQLNVPKADSKLSVEVRPSQPDYQPGNEVSVQVNVTDEAHRPAAGAEVTLYAVDKGVLSLTGYQLPGIWKSFYHDRPLDVRTGVTLPALLSEDPADMQFVGEKGDAANKGYLIGGGGEDSLRERLRQNFVACAYWNATLVTDTQGRVEAHFTAPDNLTEFQVMAIVHEGGGDKAAAGRFGGGQGSFHVNKPLMLEPALPRFGNVGDHVILRAVVHNQSPVAGEVEVTLELDDKAVMDVANGSSDDTARVRRVHLEAGESRPVEFPVEFRKTGAAKWTWHARLAGTTAGAPVWKDAVQSTLNVDHPTPRRAEIAYTHPTGSNADLLGRVDPALLEGEDGLIRVSVSTSRLSELHEGIDSLLHYPYGCIEQTVSSTLPWLVFKDFHDTMPDLGKSPEDAEEAVNRGINRILGMQTDDGGLAYWPGVTGRTSHRWGSAYGALGLAFARDAGYFVPQANVDKLCEYLSKALRSEGEDAKPVHDTYHDHDETDPCLALYALAMFDKAEPAYCETFFKTRDKLCPEDRTLVALALIKSGGDKAMIRALLQPGPRDKEKPETWNAFASPAALDGMRLLAWCLSAPRDAAVEKQLTALLGERSASGDWSTTQGNAWALMALAAYSTQVEKAAGPAAGSVSLAGKNQPFRLGGERRTFTCEFPLDALGAGKEKVVLSNADGKRILYVQTKVDSRPRGGAGANAAATTGQGGYIIQRTYQKVSADGALTDAARGKLKVGDRVLVNLDIQVPAAASYLAVNDPLPSVLEAINPDFKTAGAGGNAPTDGSVDWVSDFHELREDRAVFFCDSLSAGRFHLQYLARVRAAGTVTAPAAKIEEMYHPARYAETAAGSLTTVPLE